MTNLDYKKYCWAIVVALIIPWSISTPSHFQKGGVEPGFYFAIAFFIAVLSILINLPFDAYKLPERILVSVPLAISSLLLTSLVIGPFIVNFFYADKTWFLSETKHRILINIIYYGANAIIIAILSKVYFSLRKSKPGIV